MTSTLTFPGAWASGDEAEDPTVLVDGRLGPWDGSDHAGWQGVCDGERFLVQRHANGTHRFFHGGRLLLELSADHRRLTGDLDPHVRTTRWWRVLLDSVLFTVALLRGREAMHAGAVDTAAGVVAIAGPSGAGKSTLLAHLTGERGLELVTDDVLFLTPEADCVRAHPGPPLMTVPRTASATPGEPVADIDDEIWTACPVAAGPRTLRRIVVLDRSGGPRALTSAETDPFQVLIRNLLPFPKTPARAAARLALASDLGRSVELVRLRAELTCPAPELADLVLSELSGHQPTAQVTGPSRPGP